jgi:hypothetical protein
LGAGALAGFAVSGSAIAFGAAGTGTAIATLHGIALSNATLAWLGGGTLAAGGMGVAGGAAVLGGAFLAPLLAVGGHLWESHTRVNLQNARVYLADARSKAAEMRTVETTLRNISDLSMQCDDFIRDFSPRFQRVIGEMNSIYGRHCNEARETLWGTWSLMMGRDVKVDYRRLELREKQTLHTAWLMAQTLKKLMDAPILTQNGDIDREITTIISGCRDVSNKLLVQGL